MRLRSSLSLPLKSISIPIERECKEMEPVSKDGREYLPEEKWASLSGNQRRSILEARRQDSLDKGLANAHASL